MKKTRKKATRKNGLSFYVKIKLLDGKVISRRSPIKRKVLNFLQANGTEFKWVYLLVTYKPGFYNDGKYKMDQVDELWKAWRAFTEESLIKEVIEEY